MTDTVIITIKRAINNYFRSCAVLFIYFLAAWNALRGASEFQIAAQFR